MRGKFARLFLLFAFLPALLAVAACGGGGSAVAPPSPLDNIRTEEFRANYGLAAIHAEYAYVRGSWGQGVTVGVFDSGLRETHDEFAGNAVAGINFYNDKALPDDDTGHGTQLAGIIAAARDGKGVHGVAPSATILPFKFFNKYGPVGGNLTEPLRYATENGVNIVNNSYWYPRHRLLGKYAGGGDVPAGDYRIFIPYGIWTHGFKNFGGIAHSIGNVFRDKDIAMVWITGNGYWNPVSGNMNPDKGRVKMRKFSCAQDNKACRTTTIVTVSYAEMSQNFSSPAIKTGGGEFLKAGFNMPLSDFYSNIPVWAIGNIAEVLRDASDANASITLSVRDLFARFMENSDFRAIAPRWLAAGATDEGGEISPYSNGCGFAAMWCLMAPADGVVTTDNAADDAYITLSTGGTSFAAPHVSGALAVLKSAMPSMPMTVISRILLTTATDMGDPGVDEVYGWGMLNLRAAIEFQDNAQSAGTAQFPAALLKPKTSRVVLPASMVGVREQLRAAEVAFELPGGLYYNTPLSEFVEVQPSPEFALGNAAADMLGGDNGGRTESGMFFADADSQGVLRHAGANINGGAFGAWRLRHDFVAAAGGGGWQQWQDADAAAAPFFAGHDRFLLQMRGDGLRPFAALGKSSEDGDSTYRQFGLRWRGGGERVALLAEASMIDEENYFMGADWRALGEVESRTWQGRVVLRGAPLWGWKNFIKAETASGDVDIKGNGFLRGASGLRADGYVAGLERELFGGDKLRLWAGRETSLRSGKLRLRYPQAEGDFASAFYGVGGQTIQMRESEVDLSGGSVPIFALGYAFRLSDGARAAFGAERRGGESAVSAALRVNF